MGAPPSYLCVFHAAAEIADDVRDLGDDPDFTAPATWGICRPNTRRAVQPGSHVFFVGYLREPTRYLMKGWIRVGEKIGYLEALERFGDRPNVIVRDAASVGLPDSGQVTWKRGELRPLSEERYGPSPDWLTTIASGDRVLVQRPADDHELDNWKCQRIFMCRRRQFLICLDEGNCLRESVFPGLHDYVVADLSMDVGRARLPWDRFAPPRLPSDALRTPYGQHNTQLLMPAEVELLKEALVAATGIG